MANVPISNMTVTWTDSGTTYNAVKMNVTDTASNAASNLMDLQVGSASKFKVDKTGVVTVGNPAGGFINFVGIATPGINVGNGASIVSAITGAQVNVWDSNVNTTSLNTGGVVVRASASVAWGSGTSVGSPDIFLARDAANTLAQRNATNAQNFRVYNTYTDASNYERGKIEWSANNLEIGVEAAGTGTKRPVGINGANINFRPLSAATTAVWQMAGATGHFLAVTDSTYDIGASGANRPRNVYVGVDIVAGGSITTGSASLINFFGRTMMISPSDGVMRLSNNAQSDFGRLQFGGTTSSFPSLKRNSTALETKLADDSAYAPHAMQYLDVTDGVTAPGAATGRARIYVDTADGDLKVVFADGTVKTIVTDT